MLDSFLFAALFALGGDARGTMRYHSCDTFAFRLELTRVAGQDPNKKLDLDLPGEWYLRHNVGKWVDVLPGMSCLPSGECEAPSKSAVVVRQISGGAISGDYSLEYADGRKVSGSFKAKRPPETWICE